MKHKDRDDISGPGPQDDISGPGLPEALITSANLAIAVALIILIVVTRRKVPKVRLLLNLISIKNNTKILLSLILLVFHKTLKTKYLDLNTLNK